MLSKASYLVKKFFLIYFLSYKHSDNGNVTVLPRCDVLLAKNAQNGVSGVKIEPHCCNP